MIKFRAEYEMWSDRITLRMADMRNGQKISVAKSITFEEIEHGTYTEPLITLEKESAQELIDSLYAAGLRPSAAAGSAGQLDAVKYHLEDMRKLVFK